MKPLVVDRAETGTPAPTQWRSYVHVSLLCLLSGPALAVTAQFLGPTKLCTRLRWRLRAVACHGDADLLVLVRVQAKLCHALAFLLPIIYLLNAVSKTTARTLSWTLHYAIGYSQRPQTARSTAMRPLVPCSTRHRARPPPPWLPAISRRWPTVRGGSLPCDAHGCSAGTLSGHRQARQVVKARCMYRARPVGWNASEEYRGGWEFWQLVQSQGDNVCQQG